MGICIQVLLNVVFLISNLRKQIVLQEPAELVIKAEEMHMEEGCPEGCLLGINVVFKQWWTQEGYLSCNK